jgi:hypothetical protein
MITSSLFSSFCFDREPTSKMVGFLLLLPEQIAAQSTVEFLWQNSFIDYQ